MTPTIWICIGIFSAIAVSNWWADLYLQWYNTTKRSENWKTAVLTFLFCFAMVVGIMFPFAYAGKFAV